MISCVDKLSSDALYTNRLLPEGLLVTFYRQTTGSSISSFPHCIELPLVPERASVSFNGNSEKVADSLVHNRPRLSKSITKAFDLTVAAGILLAMSGHSGYD
jgi:hypothetical protein